MQKTVLNQNKGYNETRGKKTEMKGKELKESIKDAIIFPELKVDPDEIKLKLDQIMDWNDNETNKNNTNN